MIKKKLITITIVKLIFETLNNTKKFSEMFHIRAEEVLVKGEIVVPFSTFLQN